MVLNHELDFFHCAAEVGAGGGGELQVAVAVYAVDGGAEGLAVVDVVGFDAEAVEAAQVVGPEGAECGGLAQLAVAAQDVVEQCAKDCVEVERIMPRWTFEQQRSGVGNPVGENCLIDIQADAADGAGYVAVAQMVGGQDATHFAVADINVVGPLYVNGERRTENGERGTGNGERRTEIGELLLQRFGHGEGEGHREVVLVGGIDECRFKDKAECQILACFADPYVALLAYASGLAAGTNNGKLLDGVDVEEFTVVVG